MASRASSRLISRIALRQSTPQIQARTYSTAPSYRRPPYPSVEVLLHLHNLSASDITATGPQGRLLKGDVLAHIGSINKETPDKLSKRFEKLSHLDLSNVTPAAPKERESSTSPVVAPEVAPEVTPEVKDVEELSLAIDLKPLLKLQKRLQDVLGQTPELSELIARAVDLANRDLPASSRPPTTDELFDEIIAGPQHRRRLEDGLFVPAINASAPAPPPMARALDVFDELMSSGPVRTAPIMAVRPALSQGAVGAINEFSVVTSSQDRRRATVFLQRMKSVMEVEPGRLVL